MPEDISRYYTDLLDDDLVTRLALVHQRFSTNTFPSWELAQPFRYMCHNGEINTLRGNISRMRAREELMKSDVFGEDVIKMLPIILEGKSDSASLDMVIELLLMTGRSLPEAMMMVVPEAWEKHQTMSDDKKAFYEYNKNFGRFQYKLKFDSKTGGKKYVRVFNTEHISYNKIKIDPSHSYMYPPVYESENPRQSNFYERQVETDEDESSSESDGYDSA
jgi:hypothetical protein